MRHKRSRPLVSSRPRILYGCDRPLRQSHQGRDPKCNNQDWAPKPWAGSEIRGRGRTPGDTHGRTRDARTPAGRSPLSSVLRLRPANGTRASPPSPATPRRPARRRTPRRGCASGPTLPTVLSSSRPSHRPPRRSRSPHGPVGPLTGSRPSVSRPCLVFGSGSLGAPGPVVER